MTKTKKVLLILLPLLLIGGGLFALTRRKKPVTPPKKKPAEITFGDLSGGIQQDALMAFTKDGARLRATPSTDSKIVKTFSANETVFITSSAQATDGVWYEVNDGEGNTGWMRDDTIDLLLT